MTGIGDDIHPEPDPNPRKRFEVRSARNAEFFRCDRPWAAISVSSSGDFPVLAEENRVELLRIAFEDITDEGKPGSFTVALATEILDFVGRLWDKVEMFLVHCEIGLSRSPAIAAALSRMYYGDDGPWAEHDFPNPLVYQVLVEAAGVQISFVRPGVAGRFRPPVPPPVSAAIMGA
jgi:hypothetical protein